MPRNVEGGRNELDMFGGGSGGLLTFYNYGPDGAPSNAPPTAFERGITRAPLESFGLMDVITDREQIENILNPPQFAIGPGYDDQNVSKEPPELGPTEDLGIEDSIFQILYDTIIGEQGIPEGVSPEVINAIEGDFGDAVGAEDLRVIAEQIAEAGGFDQWLKQQDIVLGDPGQIDEDTTRSPVETIFEDDGTITTIIDPTLITLPPLLGDPVIEDTSGGGATALPETEGTPQPTELEPETTPESESGGVVDLNENTTTDTLDNDGIDETGVGNFPWFKVEDGQVYVIDLETGEYVTPESDYWEGYLGENPEDGYYADNGMPIDSESEDITPEGTDTSGPSIVIAPPPSVSSPATTPSDVVTEEPAGTQTPSDTANTGTDAAGQDGQQGTDTGGTGPGEGGNGGDDTGDGVDDPKGMFKDTFTPLTYNIGYAPVQLQQQIRPQQTNAMDQITRLIGRQTGMLV